MDALLVRAAAAHELVGAGLMDGMLALSYVIFPSADVEAASEEAAAEHACRRGASEARRARALELVDSGLSHAEVARRLGIPRPTISDWVRNRRR